MECFVYFCSKGKGMFQQFERFIKDHHLVKPNKKVLLAVSGGIDSMVMTHLFQKARYRMAIAHCNFELRGKESDGDEDFIRSYALKYNIPFFQERFNTREYAERNGISIQMAARDLRLNWFENIRKIHGFQSIALAHNQNDNVETFLINLSRGTGLQGLTGIQPKFGHLIRPLLFASRTEIENYQKKNKIPYREDSSNAETIYLRNKIRHQVIPLLKEINPAIKDVISRSIEHLSEVQRVYYQAIDEAYRELVRHEKNRVLIRIAPLQVSGVRNSILFEILKNYGLNRPQLADINHILQAKPGKQVITSTHRIIRDREYLVVTPIKNEPDDDIFIESSPADIDHPLSLSLRTVPVKEEPEISRNTQTATLDSDLIEFPLRLRKWKPGDAFMPFGMEQMKKISDFFIDLKLSIPQKEDAWILTDAFHRIIWVVGYRIDNRFRVNPESTSNILKVELLH